jgi:hypothetical protein
VFRSQVDHHIRPDKSFFQGIRFPNISIDPEMRILFAVVFIGDGYGLFCGNKTCCKTGADKTGIADDGDAYCEFRNGKFILGISKTLLQHKRKNNKHYKIKVIL